MPLIKFTDKITPQQRKKLSYRTRMMSAYGDEVYEAGRSDAHNLIKAGWAEEVSEAPPPRRGPGRPPKAKEQAEPDPTPAEEPWEPTRSELLARAEELGVELPAGYVSKDKLADLVAKAEAGAEGRF